MAEKKSVKIKSDDELKKVKGGKRRKRNRRKKRISRDVNRPSTKRV